MLRRFVSAIVAVALLASPATAQRVGIGVGLGGAGGNGGGGGTPSLSALSGAAVGDAATGTVVASPTSTLSGCTWSLAAQSNFAQASGTGVVTKAAASIGAGTYTPATTCTVVINNQTITISAALGLLISAAAQAGPTAVPAAPTVSAISGDGQALLSITDNASSQQVRKWGVYRSSTSGGAKTFTGWAYTKDQLYRRSLANGATEYYTVTAYNDLGEGPPSGEVSASPSATNYNPARLLGVVLFKDTLFYEPIGGEWKTGAAVTVSSSDGTPLQVKTQNGQLLVYGTFSSIGRKTLTFAQDGFTNTQVVDVVARPSFATAAALRPTALALKARIDNKPTYTPATSLTITDAGATKPTGFTYTSTIYAGKSILPPAVPTALGNFVPASNQTRSFDYVEQKSFLQLLAANVGGNAVLRFKNRKQTWTMGVVADAGGVATHHRVRYSDDGMQTFMEAPDPTWIKNGTHYLVFDPGSVPPSTGRIWEVEFSAYSALTNNPGVVTGFGFEAGDTVEAVSDDSPIIAISADSFANGANAIDSTRNQLRTTARRLGVLNAWNLAIPSHRWTYPASKTYPLASNLMGANVLNYGNLQLPPRLDVWLAQPTINDNSQGDIAQWQAIWTNVLLKARYLRPTMFVEANLGAWAPQDRIATEKYNALKAAFADASGNGSDKGMILNDGIADGWAVAAGGTGSSQYFPASVGQAITGSTAGDVLTVTAGSGVEVGMALQSGASAYESYGKGVAIYKQLTGTAGGVGTYRLTVAPTGGDLAAGTSMYVHAEGYATSYPVHPNALGHEWLGERNSSGIIAAVNAVLAQ